MCFFFLFFPRLSYVTLTNPKRLGPNFQIILLHRTCQPRERKIQMWKLCDVKCLLSPSNIEREYKEREFGENSFLLVNTVKSLRRGNDNRWRVENGELYSMKGLGKRILLWSRRRSFHFMCWTCTVWLRLPTVDVN